MSQQQEPTSPPFDPTRQLADELALSPQSVAAVLRLLAEKATVPFIARYRKEVTGGLDEVQIRTIEERGTYLRELEDRRGVVLASIEEQGKLTPELRQRILACTTRQALEDLYLPFRPKRRTRAMIARERGLEPLAQRILEQGTSGDPAAEAAAFVDPEREVPDVRAALAGARDIVAETMAENADIRSWVRAGFERDGVVVAQVAPGKDAQPTQFEQYYDFRESVATIPSHRYLAIRRGEREDVLRVRIEVDEPRVVERITAMMGHRPASPWAGELAAAVQDGFRRLLAPSVETDLRVEMKLNADRGAVDVFAENLRNLLMAAPLGGRGVIGVDPGLRTGCKVAVLDDTGRFVDNTTLYLVGSDEREAAARRELTRLVERYRPHAIAVGNGTGGRQTEAFIRATLKAASQADVIVVSVNEAGASVYSASDVAREEFPDLDLTVRGAISIARRLQDPLAELVKLDPKSIGVGQYQHDVHQPLLQRKLGDVVESCVNAVGVELNTASAPLLSYVAGVGPTLARRIVDYRTQHGRFLSRDELLKVSGLGPRTYEQCAGFLRVREARNPLDRSAVHPERYALVERIAADVGVTLEELVGNPQLAERIDVSRYVGEGVGELTLRDIVAELRKPGLDPRAEFEPPRFRDDVHELEDLRESMILEGVVTNVTAFGAFVDVGVHQDGLVHISRLSDRFVRDPSEVVRVGDRVTVKVLEVDLQRRRVSLSCRLDDEPGAESGGGSRGGRAAGADAGGGSPRGGGRPGGARGGSRGV